MKSSFYLRIKQWLRLVAEMVHDHLVAYMSSTGMMLHAVTLPNGSILAIASGYGSAKDMTALSNADPGVATLEASHGVSTGDILEITSGWARLNNRIVRAGTVATNDVPLEGIKTTDTVRYPSGSGIGSVREISGWTQIQQILNSTGQGGDQNFLEYGFLEMQDDVRIPTNRSAAGVELDIADDPTLAGYILAQAADDDGEPRAFKLTLPNGSIIFYNAYVTVGQTPILTRNQLMAVKMTLSFLSLPTRYTS